MSEIPGVEVISDVEPGYFPKRVEISFDVVYIGQRVLTVWNINGMSFIPYCTECKEPLNWFSPPEGDILFRCPKCKREWVKDTEWLMKDEKLLGKKK